MSRLLHAVPRLLTSVLAVQAVWLAGCGVEGPPLSRRWLAMGTFASVTSAGNDRAQLDTYAVTARHVLQQLEAALSTFIEHSDVSRLNSSAGVSAVRISPSTREVLALAAEYARISDGCFDPTVGPLLSAWGFRGGPVPERPLDDDRVRAVQELTGYGQLVLEADSAMLVKPGMSIDLGGIAKGYAVDVCYRKLGETGARRVMVNLGGNIRCRGTAQKRRPWTIGVQSPFEPGRLLGTIALPDGMAADDATRHP